jgi:hypothetical protein
MLIKVKRGHWLFPRLYNTNGLIGVLSVVNIVVKKAAVAFGLLLIRLVFSNAVPHQLPPPANFPPLAPSQRRWPLLERPETR